MAGRRSRSCAPWRRSSAPCEPPDARRRGSARRHSAGRSEGAGRRDRRRGGPRARGIVPVHVYGQMAPLEQLETAARAAGVLLIEDAAQAQGAMRHGIGAGGFGVAAGTSFYPGKNLGAYGDAGAVLTGSAELAAKVRALGNYGSEVKYEANARAVPGERPLGTIACPEHQCAHRRGGYAYYRAV